MARFAKVTLWVLRDGRGELSTLLEHLASWGNELERLVGEGDDDDVRAILRYIFRVTGPAGYDALRERALQVAPNFEASMATAEEFFIQKGIEKGIEKGARQMLARLLGARFGLVEAATLVRIDAASSDELDRWAERVLTAKTIDDVFVGE